MAYTNTYSSADLYAIPDLHPLANSDVNAAAGSHSRAYVHAVPDIHAMAYVDTDTCSYCHCGADTDSDSDAPDTDPCANSYGRTYAHPDTSAYTHPYAYADLNIKYSGTRDKGIDVPSSRSFGQGRRAGNNNRY